MDNREAANSLPTIAAIEVKVIGGVLAGPLSLATQARIAAGIRRHFGVSAETVITFSAPCAGHSRPLEVR